MTVSVAEKICTDNEENVSNRVFAQSILRNFAETDLVSVNKTLLTNSLLSWRKRYFSERREVMNGYTHNLGNLSMALPKVNSQQKKSGHLIFFSLSKNNIDSQKSFMSSSIRRMMSTSEEKPEPELTIVLSTSGKKAA